MQQNTNILQVNGLSKYFGGLAAVSNCTLNIKKGSITGIIGPNGSGKTTLFNLIAGNLKPNQGKVLFNNDDITGVPAYELFSKGILREDGALSFSLNLLDEINTKTTKVAIYGIIVNI